MKVDERLCTETKQMLVMSVICITLQFMINTEFSSNNKTVIDLLSRTIQMQQECIVLRHISAD